MSTTTPIIISSLSLIISSLSLIFAFLSFILNYYHTNKLFRRSHYSDLQIVLGKTDDLCVHPAIWIRCHGTTNAIEIKSVIHFIPPRPMFCWRSPTKTKIFYYPTLKPQESVIHSFEDISFDKLLISFGLAQSEKSEYSDYDSHWTILKVQPHFLRRLVDRLLLRVVDYIDEHARQRVVDYVEKHERQRIDKRFKKDLATYQKKESSLSIEDMSIANNFALDRATREYIIEKRPFPYNFIKWCKTYVYSYKSRPRTVTIEAVLFVTWKAASTEGEYILKHAQYKLESLWNPVLNKYSKQEIDEGFTTFNEEQKVLKLDYASFNLPLFQKDQEPSANRLEPISINQKYKDRPFTLDGGESLG